MTYPLLNYEQASGRPNFMESYYKPQLLQEELLKQHLANALSQAKMPYAAPMEEAELKYKQAQTPYIEAQTGAIPSEIELRHAQANAIPSEIEARKYETELRKIQAQFEKQKVEHPERYFEGPAGDIARLDYLRSGGQAAPPASGGGLPPPQGGMLEKLGRNLQQLGYGGQPPSANTQQMPQNVQQPSLMPAQQQGSAIPDRDQMIRNYAATGNPLLSAEQKNAQIAQATEQKNQAAANVASYKDIFDKAYEDAKVNNNVNRDLDDFYSAYKKTNQKGTYLGRVFAFGSDAQIADRAAASMQAQFAKLVAQGRVSNMDLTFTGGLKVNRAMNPKAVDKIYDILKMETAQDNEKLPFMAAARNSRLDPQIAELIWNKYLSENKPYNFKDGKKNTQALKEWQSYLSPKNLKQIEDDLFGGVPIRRYDPATGEIR